MSQPVISVAGLGKRYYLAHQQRHDTLRDSLAHGARGLLRRLTSGATAAPVGEEFWALHDVSFDVQQGDVVGIIGRNGAGKSTLLKILSRITEPTAGRAVIRGRVASLLEVGTGFHPELSGRENIFLNGAILGMSRAEITRKFDEIVAFAEVERFLDTQVKHYSSGMYVRLAFSVAAHLEPEILIVDEVLAVGDAQFQKKCLGKMGEVTRESGRTILFVSHNLDAVNSICSTGLLMECGRIKAQGGIAELSALYLEPALRHSASFAHQPERPCIVQVVLDDAALARRTLAVRIRFSSPFPLNIPTGGLVLASQEGRALFGTNMRLRPPGEATPAREGECCLEVPNLPLQAGVYSISVWLGDSQRDFDSKADALSFALPAIANAPPTGGSHLNWPLDLECQWHLSATRP
jgi:lipopolysaccharide transport system ATP-binding protein